MNGVFIAYLLDHQGVQVNSDLLDQFTVQLPGLRL